MNIKDLPTLLPYNIKWHDIFKNNNPVDLEIGCGRTHFLFDRAKNLKERNIIGIEYKYEFIEQAQRKIIRENIPNARAFHGNAWFLVPLLFAPDSISQVIINFPDPWWKGRHKKRLILNNIFINNLYNIMKQDSCILLQSDVCELFEYYSSLIISSNLFKQENNINFQEFNQAQSHREKKCLEQGLIIYRALFRRVGGK